jgi:hypothetical protein
LFERDGATLVKDATRAQAVRASTIPIGGTVEVDERGRLHEHQSQPSPPEQPKGQER